MTAGRHSTSDNRSPQHSIRSFLKGETLSLKNSGCEFWVNEFRRNGVMVSVVFIIFNVKLFKIDFKPPRNKMDETYKSLTCLPVYYFIASKRIAHGFFKIDVVEMDLSYNLYWSVHPFSCIHKNTDNCINMKGGRGFNKLFSISLDISEFR